MRSKKEIDKQIATLKEIRPKVRPYSMFGDSNLDKLDAMVRVLDEDCILMISGMNGQKKKVIWISE